MVWFGVTRQWSKEWSAHAIWCIMETQMVINFLKWHLHNSKLIKRRQRMQMKTTLTKNKMSFCKQNHMTAGSLNIWEIYFPVYFIFSSGIGLTCRDYTRTKWSKNIYMMKISYSRSKKYFARFVRFLRYPKA